jgi:UDP-hydrolysing UDP-N-acetyl-D-glucosamine 2-epimerase
MNIHYVTGSRADFGLMKKVLRCLDAQRNIDLGLVVTGQHLLEHYGATVNDIIESNLKILCKIPVELNGSSGAQMARAFGKELLGLIDFWQTERPDLVLVLGDRGEMLAAALAAVHLGIHVGHIHGGEVSGTLDESFRHAISKLAHYHFTATAEAAERLRRMGECQSCIWTIGAPGLVDIKEGVIYEPSWLSRRFNLKATGDAILLVFHPVVQEATIASKQLDIILHHLLNEDCYGVILRPNSDSGGEEIDRSLDKFSKKPEVVERFRVLKHLARSEYLNCLANCKIVVGNSSSGIIESASFDLACINVGDRQKGRLRNQNVVDCEEISHEALNVAFKQARRLRPPFINQYGDGMTAERLVDLLSRLKLSHEVLAKTNVY